jgi:hypothetical protein
MAILLDDQNLPRPVSFLYLFFRVKFLEELDRTRRVYTRIAGVDGLVDEPLKGGQFSYPKPKNPDVVQSAYP